ncbi:MAG TPA: hypothetical protein VJ841_03700 [Candidatus Saccharimonadales bacterium]|nr:hypothetical protein [Candidatus Saccharimonadales bacterium]
MNAQRSMRSQFLRGLFLVVVPPLLMYLGGMMLWPLWGEINYFDPTGNLHVVMPTRSNLWQHLGIAEAWFAIGFGSVIAGGALKLLAISWRKCMKQLDNMRRHHGA